MRTTTRREEGHAPARHVVLVASTILASLAVVVSMASDLSHRSLTSEVQGELDAFPGVISAFAESHEGGAPASYDELARWRAGRIPSDPWADGPYTYVRFGEHGFAVLSVGDDGEAWTEDDLEPEGSPRACLDRPWGSS